MLEKFEFRWRRRPACAASNRRDACSTFGLSQYRHPGGRHPGATKSARAVWQRGFNSRAPIVSDPATRQAPAGTSGHGREKRKNFKIHVWIHKPRPFRRAPFMSARSGNDPTDSASGPTPPARYFGFWLKTEHAVGSPTPSPGLEPSYRFADARRSHSWPDDHFGARRFGAIDTRRPHHARPDRTWLRIIIVIVARNPDQIGARRCGRTESPRPGRHQAIIRGANRVVRNQSRNPG